MTTCWRFFSGFQAIHVFCSWAAFLGKGMVFDSHDICEESFFYNSVQQGFRMSSL